MPATGRPPPIPEDAVPPGGDRPAARIGLLDGTELLGEFRSSGYREASHLVRRPDGRIIRLAPVPYAVVAALDRRRLPEESAAGDLLARVGDDASRESGFELTADHVAYLLDRKLAPVGLTTDSNGVRPPVADPGAVFSLRVKKAILPSAATWFLGGLGQWLFRPPVVVAVVLAALAGEAWLFTTQPMGSALARAVVDPAGLGLVVGLAIASAFFHEIGHATACRYSGARPGPIGGGLYFIWPVFYTDITDSYRLDRAGRLRTVLGGVYFNALMVVGLTLLSAWTGDSILLAVVLVVNLEIIQQLLPTLRFDGYFIVADLVGVPDLYKYIGPILKRTLLRRRADARLAALEPWPQRVVTIWILLVLPLLVVQVAFIVVQLPALFRLASQRLATMLSGADVGQILVGLGPTLVALFPFVALTALVAQAGRGAGRVVRRRRAVADRGREVADGRRRQATAGWRRPAPLIRRRAIRVLSVVDATVLAAAGGYLAVGGGERAPASPAAVAPSWQPASTAGGHDPDPGAGVEPRSEVATFPIADAGHTEGVVVYPQSPPVGGPHSPTWASCRFHDRPVPAEWGVHSMEHGAIWVTYRPDLPADQIAVLARLAHSRPKMLVSPWGNDLPAPVVASAWGRQLRLASATDPRLEQFAAAFTGRAPEPNGPC